ncbi:MAG TPA: c-type cytochrome, partial [Burkholderiaceae bacterium]|nr:c-type cytochrome [Burkholderiaceae bacterium]
MSRTATARIALLAAAVVTAGIAAAPPVRAAPDATRGGQIYVRCVACHAPAADRVGPHHCGLLGRRAGSVPDFAYSDAMKRSGIVWNDQSLDRFLAAPMKAVPGTTMTYDGIADRDERADLIAYLRQIDRLPDCRTA